MPSVSLKYTPHLAYPLFWLQFIPENYDSTCHVTHVTPLASRHNLLPVLPRPSNDAIISKHCEQTPESMTMLHGPDATAIAEGEMAITALFLLIGGALRFRFKVLILLPAITLTVIVTSSIEISAGQDAWSSALATLAAVFAIQTGYLIGIAACAVATHAMTITQETLDRPQLGPY